jgi:hypothetical protein
MVSINLEEKLNKQLEVQNPQDLVTLKTLVLETTERTTSKLRDLTNQKNGIALFNELRFTEAGQDPLADRPLNLIEQLNQTFTYLASFSAAEYLLKIHPEHSPFVINLGTSPGSDVASKDGLVIAEVFTALARIVIKN